MAELTFGKHRGADISDLPLDYLTWVLRTGESDVFGRIGEFVRDHGDEIRATLHAAYASVADDYELTAHQRDAVDVVARALVTGPANVYRLDGGAGYGKSYCVADIVRQALLAGLEVNACATSYIATQVLARQLQRTGIPVRTIASLCRLDRVDDEDRESYEVTAGSHEAMANLLRPGRMMVVDEWSMVGDEVADVLLGYAAHGGKLLAVGDAYQLPPVGQRDPSSFSRVPGVVELQEPMRFPRTSDLYTLEQLTRYQPRSIYDYDWDGSDTVRTVQGSRGMFAQFLDDRVAHPMDDGRILYYRRDDVRAANDTVRSMLYGDAARREPVIADERVMVMRTTDVGKDTLTGEDGVRYYSGETFLVDEVEPGEESGIPCYRLRLHGRAAPVPVLMPGGDVRGAREYRRALSDARSDARGSSDWRAYRALRDRFLPVGYNYAMTVHRCQGQTVDRVHFDPRRLQSPEGAALTYVAATRASKQATLVR